MRNTISFDGAGPCLRKLILGFVNHAQGARRIRLSLVFIGLIAILSLISSCIPIDKLGLMSNQTTGMVFQEDGIGSEHVSSSLGSQRETQHKLALGPGLSLSGALSGRVVQLPVGPILPNPLPRVVGSTMLPVAPVEQEPSRPSGGGISPTVANASPRKDLFPLGHDATPMSSIPLPLVAEAAYPSISLALGRLPGGGRIGGLSVTAPPKASGDPGVQRDPVTSAEVSDEAKKGKVTKAAEPTKILRSTEAPASEGAGRVGDLADPVAVTEFAEAKKVAILTETTKPIELHEKQDPFSFALTPLEASFNAGKSTGPSGTKVQRSLLDKPQVVPGVSAKPEGVTTPGAAASVLMAAAEVPAPQADRAELARLSGSNKPGGSLDGLPGLGVRISVDLRQMDMLAVLKFLAEEGSLNIVAGKNVGGRVSLTLKDVSLQDILDIIALSYELAYVVQNDIIHIMTEADYQRLFGASFADQRKVKRLQLQNADPAAVSAVLNNMKSAVGRVIADVQSRTIVLVDVPEKLEPMAATAASMDRATELQTRIFELHYGKVEEIQAEVEKALTPNLGSSRLDKRSNTLVVTDLPTRLPNVERIIGAFDRKTREVIIESKIVQVRLNDQFQMGVDWQKLFKQLADLNLKASFPITPPVSLLGQLTVGTLAEDNFNVVVQLLQTVGKANILSRPQIAVVENQEAKILVGTREAFVTSVVTQTQQAATTAEEVTFIDVGVSLTATPTINKEGFVTMKIKPEVSSVNRVLTTANGNGIPIVETSTAETTVMVKDGATIVIGGLMKDDNIHETKKVPFLGDIPIIGAAFRSKDENTVKSELVIFLTPRIISGQESVAGVSSTP